MEKPELKKLLKVGQFDFINVLLTGETGTGKTHYANLIHQNSSRKNKPFVSINCASLPKELIEAELFGAERGSFTGASSAIVGKFEAANGGSVFLDEIGELENGLQAKLLTVLEDKMVRRLGSNRPVKLDLRFIFATNQPLSVFRSDFRCRISAFQFEIKPLRERKDEIFNLARIFLSELNQKHCQNINFSRCILKFLETQEWFGNVRELKNFINRLYISTIIANLTEINLSLLEDFQLDFMPPSDSQNVMAETIPYVFVRKKVVRLSEKEIEAFELYKSGKIPVKDILTQTSINKSRFYRLLGQIADHGYTVL